MACPIIGNDGVYSQVTTVMNNMWGNSSLAFNTAIQAMTDLGSFTLHPINIGTSFNTDDQWWHMERPVGPARPELVFNPDNSLVPLPPSTVISHPTFVAPPTFNETAPVVPPRPSPGPLTAVVPEGPPDLDEVVVPDAPDLDIPDFPELRAITLPDPPTIVLPTFQGQRPEFSISTPENTFGFTAEHYSSAMLDQIKQRISVMINGSPGLPDAAARAMRDRAFASVDQQGLRAEQEAIEVFASRGWSEPDGVLAMSLREVRQNNQNERNKLSRDIYLEDVKLAIEDMRFAVAQGVALEGQLMGNFLGTQQLMLDAAKTTIQVAIDVMNAEVALANLELQVFKADAEVFRELIQAELAKLEVYKATLDGKRLIGELNAQDVAVYSERVKALLIQVEIFKAEVEGAKAKADVNMTRTQVFGEQVRAYAAQVGAYEAEWDAHKTALEGDLAQYRRYELATQVFGNRVKIWGDINQNKIDQTRLQISEKDLDLNAYRARLDKLDATLRAEVARIGAVTSIYGADIDKYRADAAIEQVVSEGNARPFQLALEQEKHRVDADMQNAQLRITQAIEIGKLMVSKIETIAQTAGTLAAGLASAMHVGANISSSLSQGSSCSTEFKYEGPIA